MPQPANRHQIVCAFGFMRKIPLLLLLAAGLLAACGQKGPLYLPEEPESRPAAATGGEPAADSGDSETDADDADD